MKKFTLILSTILLIQAGNLFAQTDVVNFTAILSSVLNINVTGGQDQTATFDTPDLYNNGIPDVGTSTITVESTSDWDLAISAPDFSDGAGSIIPINNVGVWCEATGDHAFGTEVQVPSGAINLANAQGLTNADADLITNAGTNAGDASDNAFNLNWAMGTTDGSMNGASIFDQLSDGTIGALGTYTTVVTLTLTAL